MMPPLEADMSMATGGVCSVCSAPLEVGAADAIHATGLHMGQPTGEDPLAHGLVRNMELCLDVVDRQVRVVDGYQGPRIGSAQIASNLRNLVVS